VARGRFELHLDESGNDEMARLAASMNTMSGAVRDKIRRLEEGEERMRLAMDAGRVVPWDRDLADDVLRWGAGAERLLGPVPAGMDAYPDLLSMVSTEDRDQLLQARRQAIRNKTAYQLDLNVRRTDGSQLWLAVRGKYMHIPGSIAGRLIGVARDITAGKKAEIEINRLNRELEQRVRERTQELEAAVVELEAFSYTISHDLRAPLRTLGGFSRLLAQECAANPACSSRSVYLDRIEGNVRKMSRMVDDLLRFSKAARAPLSRRQVEPNQLVSEVLDDIQFPDAARAEIRVSAMPTCWADPALLRQVYVNLISNALKYSAKADRPCVEIGVLTNADGEAVYSVRDNGAGFDASRADRLFGVFQRFHSSSEFEGTGVGLAIVQRIVIRHGGRIWAESTPGNGAAFYFTLAARARCEERAEAGKPPVAAISSA
jgi:PAS domain S-box-containing protein